MSAFKLTSAGMVALLAIAVSGQRASAQYYGYASGQAPQTSGQGGYGPGCQPERIGCNVSVCPQPGPGGIGPPSVPGITAPSCQGGFTIESELPPHRPPVTIDVWRNVYVPIKVVQRPTEVTPVNINVRWREIHFLCGADGAPLSSQQAAAVLKELQEQMAAQDKDKPAAGAAAAPAAPVASAPAAPVASAPAAPVAAAPTPAKRWVWLAGQNVWGYGYQRADGLWVIDQGSKRPTPPEEATNPASAENTNSSATTKS